MKLQDKNQNEATINSKPPLINKPSMKTYNPNSPPDILQAELHEQASKNGIPHLTRDSSKTCPCCGRTSNITPLSFCTTHKYIHEFIGQRLSIYLFSVKVNALSLFMLFWISGSYLFFYSIATDCEDHFDVNNFGDYLQNLIKTRLHEYFQKHGGTYSKQQIMIILQDNSNSIVRELNPMCQSFQSRISMMTINADGSWNTVSKIL